MADLVDIDVGKIFGGIGDCVNKIGTAIRGKDPELEGQVNIILAELQGKVVDATAAMATAQSQVNAVQAASTRFFVSGARPMAMWLCMGALVYGSMLYPIICWIATLYSIPPPPAMDTSIYVTMLMGMLGLGGMRSVDKYNGVASK